MDLCDDIVMALKPLGNSSVINDECFGKLMNACVGSILEIEPNSRVSQFGNLKPGVLKGAYTALLTLLIEGAKHNISNEILASVLTQNFNLSTERAEKIVKCYSGNKLKIQALLSHIGTHYPHIVDVNWTFDSCLKGNSFERSGMFFYLIQIRCETCHNADNMKKVTKKIKFLCTFEELQDFVNKLKDAVKHLERLAAV